MINVSMHDLLSLVSSAVSAGVQDYIRGISPDQDRVKQADARRFLKSRGIQPVMLRKWAEIKKVISAIELKKICNNSY